MAAIPGVRFDITGASGSQGLLSPKDSWRAYIFPRGAYASQSSTGTQVTFDSAAVASRFAVNNWIQSGLLTGNIRQVMGVGGNSITLNSSLTVATNDRVFLIGNTQPTVNGGSATYTTPDTLIRQRDDDAATLYTNSMVTSDTNGSAQWFAGPNLYDVLVQDGNGANQGAIYDLPCGISADYPVTFGLTITALGALNVTGPLTANTATINMALGVTGVATFGSTITANANVGVTGTLVVGATVTFTGGFSGTGIIPRLGPSSTPTTGGAMRIIEGNVFPFTVAGVQAALDEVETAGGGTVRIPAGAGVSISSTSVKIGNRVTLDGLGDHPSTATFIATPSANVSAMVENKTQNGTQQFAAVRNIWLNGNSAAGALVSTGLKFVKVYAGSYWEGVLVTGISGDGCLLDGGAANGLGPVEVRRLTVANNGGDNVVVSGICVGVHFYHLDTERSGSGKSALRIANAAGTASFGHAVYGGYIEQSDSTSNGFWLDGVANVRLDNVLFNGTAGANVVKITGSTAGSDGSFAAGGHVITNLTGNLTTIIDDRTNGIGVSISNVNGRFVRHYTSPIFGTTAIDNSQVIGLQTARTATVASGFSISISACNANFFEVTGTSRVQTIVGDSSFAGKYVTFMFSNASPQGFSTGGNIRLAGGAVWTPAQWDCLTLAYYGTTWFEMSPR